MIRGPGFGFDDLFRPPAKNMIPTYSSAETIVSAPIESIYILLINMAAYFFLAWYFDAVLPDSFGKRRNPLFFITSWFPASNTRIQSLNSGPVSEEKDVDLQLERRKAFDANSIYAIRVMNLKKVYPGEKVAIKNFCLTLEEGKL